VRVAECGMCRSQCPKVYMVRCVNWRLLLLGMVVCRECMRWPSQWPIHWRRCVRSSTCGWCRLQAVLCIYGGWYTLPGDVGTHGLYATRPVASAETHAAVHNISIAMHMLLHVGPAREGGYTTQLGWMTDLVPAVAWQVGGS
jgi:hypothetical protein